jgi:small-conductance mechanosensitive channel
MKPRENIFAGAVVLLLALASYGVYRTGRPDAPAASSTSAASADTAPVLNESSLATALRLVRLPTAADELPLAQDALRFADQEMDLAFADAVRRAAAHPKPMTKEAQDIAERLQHTQQEVLADSVLVEQLTAALAKPGGASGATNDQLDLAKARLELDRDDMDDAREDLIHAGGDPQGRMQAMVQEHEEASRSSDSTRIKVTATVDADGLVQTGQMLWTLRDKELELRAAGAAAESAAVALGARHKRLDEEAARQPRPRSRRSPETAAADSALGSATSLLLETQRRALAQKARSSVEKRGDNQHQLAGVYASWLDVLRREQRAVVNRGLRGVVLILSIVLVWLFFDSVMMHALGALRMERRSRHTLQLVTRVALQVFGVLLVLIVIFGTPSNLGTIIGLAGAGLTVALKDFIISFVGWIVLMGKNGIRIGDLVEINGVTGEVVELGLFNTVLLETGNWTDAGHPTGRRVTFTNSYAIEGHYFNFSTSGQWLWDEVRIVVPAGRDPYSVVETLQKHVEEATAESAKLAEQEWKGAGKSPGSGAVTAAPGITIKPVMGGVEMTVRYITHAAERYQVRSKLYHTAVEVLGDAQAVAVGKPE